MIRGIPELFLSHTTNRATASFVKPSGPPLANTPNKPNSINMASKDDDLQTKARRKLTKKNKNPRRMPSTHIPERLRGGEDEDEDVTAPNKAAPTPAQYLNQSVFSMIAAAGSRTNFNARFDESSDSED